VAAAASDEFDVYRGSADSVSDPQYLTYPGTLSAPSSMKCWISPRSSDGVYRPWYSCEFLSINVFTDTGWLEASQLFDQMATQLRACFSDVPFEEQVEGDPRTMVGGFRRTLLLRRSGYSVDL